MGKIIIIMTVCGCLDFKGGNLKSFFFENLWLIFLLVRQNVFIIVGNLRDREVACLASDCHGSNFEPCVWRSVSSHSFHNSHEVSWPNLSYMCTKVAKKPIHFIFVK